MKYSVLLIGEKTDSMWPLVVEQAVSTMGVLQFASEQDVVSGAIGNSYAVIMIDSGAVRDPVRLTAWLRTQHPQAKIIVATASPTWQRARDVLKAGAVDYIRKSLDEAQLQSTIKTLLDDDVEPK